MTENEKFSILTPLFDPPDYLTGCMRSVFFQSESLKQHTIGLQHILQNGGEPSKIRHLCENHREFTRSETGPVYTFGVHSERDSGMYDALNRAYAASSGSMIGHLNADEQYLHGTLAMVAETFRSNPDVDVVTGAAIVVDGHGKYLCTRPAVIPSQIQLELSYLTLFTCATFFRRSSICKLGMYYDTSYRYRGDAELISRILENGLNIQVLCQPLSAFLDDGNNLALSKGAVEEKQRMRQRHARSAFLLKPMTATLTRLKLLKAFQTVSKPFDYTWIHPDGSPEKIFVTKPSLKWPARIIRDRD